MARSQLSLVFTTAYCSRALIFKPGFLKLCLHFRAGGRVRGWKLGGFGFFATSQPRREAAAFQMDGKRKRRGACGEGQKAGPSFLRQEGKGNRGSEWDTGQVETERGRGQGQGRGSESCPLESVSRNLSRTCGAMWAGAFLSGP